MPSDWPTSPDCQPVHPCAAFPLPLFLLNHQVDVKKISPQRRGTAAQRPACCRVRPQMPGLSAFCTGRTLAGLTTEGAQVGPPAQSISLAICLTRDPKSLRTRARLPHDGRRHSIAVTSRRRSRSCSWAGSCWSRAPSRPQHRARAKQRPPCILPLTPSSRHYLIANADPSHRVRRVVAPRLGAAAPLRPARPPRIP